MTDERGSATVELTLLTPLLLALLLLVVLAGRTSGARNDIVGVSRDAARVASLADDPILARAAAEAFVADAIDATSCAAHRVDVGVVPAEDGAWAGAVVQVTIRCDLELRDLALLAVPGSIAIDASAVEVIDRHRSTA